MVRRSAGMAFGASAWVFPGGKVAEADADPEWTALTTGEFPEIERSLRVAAAREVFEESGLLLACARDTGEPASVAICEEVNGLREQVEGDPGLFMHMIREAGLKLSLDRLVPFAHWITPSFEPRRFDTHFYLVVAPGDQIARHDGREAVDHVWVRPQDLLAQRLKGEAKLMFPTRLNLNVLAQSATAAAAESAAKAKRVVTVEPQVIERDRVKYLRIPGEAGYGLTEERIDKVMG